VCTISLLVASDGERQARVVVDVHIHNTSATVTTTPAVIAHGRASGYLFSVNKLNHTATTTPAVIAHGRASGIHSQNCVCVCVCVCVFVSECVCLCV
jgi:hypothetical protein